MGGCVIYPCGGWGGCCGGPELGGRWRGVSGLLGLGWPGWGGWPLFLLVWMVTGVFFLGGGILCRMVYSVRFRVEAFRLHISGTIFPKCRPLVVLCRTSNTCGRVCRYYSLGYGATVGGLVVAGCGQSFGSVQHMSRLC